MFHPVENVSLFMIAHEPGEEMWYILGWLPTVAPKTSFTIDDFMMDYQITKEIFTRDEENCKPEWTMSEYSGKCPKM